MISVLIELTTIFGFVLVAMQLHNNKKLKEIEFITKFNTDFLNFDDLMKVYYICAEQAGVKIYSNNQGLSFNGNYSAVYKYIDYFEPLYFAIVKCKKM